MATHVDTNKVPPLVAEAIPKTKTEMENEIKGLKPEELTSKDYYFDSYAHFGGYLLCSCCSLLIN